MPPPRRARSRARRLADAQDIPLQFLEHILLELKHTASSAPAAAPKAATGWPGPADEVTIADVVRAVEGPIADVQSTPPEAIKYSGNAESLREVWVAVRASLRSVLEEVTLADLVSGDLPAVVGELTAAPEAWQAEHLDQGNGRTKPLALLAWSGPGRSSVPSRSSL